MHPVEQYLKNLSEIHCTGGATAETSYYARLETLLNEVGAKLKPKVRAVAQLANMGAGSPDFGLFTANQFQKAKDDKPLKGVPPERGVVEVKGWTDDSFVTAKTEQVSKYWKHYGLVLVTNYRDFVLIGRDEAGQPLRLETYRMADSEKEFRVLLAHPRKAADTQGERLLEFLRRVLLYEAALTNPEDLAWFLASYAREARHRVEFFATLPALDGLRKALEEALGMTFEGDKGEHFFQATFVQTLFYGIFSSWVLWCREHQGQPNTPFDWQKAAWTLHVPMVKSLFDQIATPTKLKPLDIEEVLDWAGAALNRVDRTAFFAKFEEEHAVQYFYEPFLNAYDPELRKELGVWYTPPEIVRYQVERVDRVLREELNLPDGLADDNVVVLDPCCGTGAYLVETLKRIHKTLKEKGGSALTAQKLKTAAMKRVFGFEILPAPFVVAHLQLGLMLRQLGAPLDHDTDQRAGVYLTNALTGWEPLKKPKDEIPGLYPELREERDAANKVKQEAPILVILGNPPYNGYAGFAMEEERDLVTAYRTTKRAPKPEGQGLNDLYIRFFRMAERRIVEKSGKGVVCYISNYSWLEGLSHTGMRERYLEVFDRVWIDCLNGDKYKTGKLTPWGESDPSIFSTDSNREGIQVGTAISLLVRKEKGAMKDGLRCGAPRFRHLWGKAKHAEILRNATGQEKAKYELLSPSVEIGYPLMPAQVDAGYLTWPQLPKLFPVSFPGVKTSRDEFLVDIDRAALEERIGAYFDPSLSHEEIARRWPSVMEEREQYKARKIRDYLVRRGRTKGHIVRYAYRPFDVRWLYWEPETDLLDRERSEYFPQVFEGNYCLVSQQKPRRDWSRPQCVMPIGCLDLFDRGATCFPLLVRQGHSANDLFSMEAEENPPNASPLLQEYSKQFPASPDLVFHHAIAIMHAAIYNQNNAGGLRQDWPRIPLPAKKKALLDSAALGRRVAALLDTEKPVDGVTCGKIDARLKPLGVIRKAGGGALDPGAGALELTAGWGHGGKGGVCMPGRGKAEERETKDEGQTKAFGDATLDIYLNGEAYWENVPLAVWDYTIGGYQVIKKWLSYREKTMLGRGLTMEETEYVTEMVRRIAALILLQPELDANYQTVKAET
ncbi:DNA methyltransferase [candidate division BRC1 bacterium HGW-BRC1-1]|jgi:hypothetical protein|nr:MAG: DNA methyltransferase [candidate division BRC1 bacterium HGW-BRC1-1]